MAIDKQQKQQILERFTKGLKESKSVVMANYEGLGVHDFEDLRKRCRKQNVQCMVIKKTLLQKGIQESNLKGQCDVASFKNGVAVFFSYKDEVSAAKIIKEFSKDHDNVYFYGAILNDEAIENPFLSKESTEALAALPSKQELLAKLVGSISSPLSGLVNVLSAPMKDFIGALNAIESKKS